MQFLKLMKRSPFTMISLLFLVFGAGLIFYITNKYNIDFIAFLKTQFINFDSGNFGTLPETGEGITVDDIPFLEPLVYRLFDIAKTVFEGVAIFLIVFYGMKMMLAGGESADLGKHATGILDAVIGLLLIQIIGTIVAVFDPLAVGRDIVSVPTYELIFGKATEFIQYSAGIVAFVVFFIAGYRLVFPGSKGSETIKTSGNQILYGILGLFVIMIAEVAQYAVVGGREGVLGGGQTGINRSLIVEVFDLIESILKVVMYFYMPIAVVIVIYAGVKLILQGYNESTWGQTLSILKNVFISIIILLSAYTLVAEILKYAQ